MPVSVEVSENEPGIGITMQGLFEVLTGNNTRHIGFGRTLKRKLKVKVRDPSAIFLFPTHFGKYLAFFQGHPLGNSTKRCPAQMPVQGIYHCATVPFVIFAFSDPGFALSNFAHSSFNLSSFAHSSSRSGITPSSSFPGFTGSTGS